MHISGTEPSSLFLSRTMEFKKLTRDAPKVSKQADGKRDSKLQCLLGFYRSADANEIRNERNAKLVLRILNFFLFEKYIRDAFLNM